MTQSVYYNDERLGRVKINDNGTLKLVFIAENLDSMIKLFSLKPEDVVEFEGEGKIAFQAFKEETLDSISGFYPNRDAWLLKNSRSRSIEEFERIGK